MLRDTDSNKNTVHSDSETWLNSIAFSQLDLHYSRVFKSSHKQTGVVYVYMQLCVSKLTSSSNSGDSLEDNVNTATLSILYTSWPPGKEPRRVLLDITNSLQSAPIEYHVLSAHTVRNIDCWDIAQTTKNSIIIKGASSRFLQLEKFSLNFWSSTWVIRHP